MFKVSYNYDDDIFSTALGILIVILIIVGFFVVVISIDYSYQKKQCSEIAKKLDYKYEYDYLFTGCVLEKPNGKKVLLEQLRDYAE